jgi:hypothetical protein
MNRTKVILKNTTLWITKSLSSYKLLEILRMYLGIIKKPEPKSVPPATRAVQILGFYI